jgi:hypothetical protein
VRAAVIDRYGEPPVVKEIDAPKADAMVEVIGAPLNLVDISIARPGGNRGSVATPSSRLTTT